MQQHGAFVIAVCRCNVWIGGGVEYRVEAGYCKGGYTKLRAERSAEDEGRKFEMLSFHDFYLLKSFRGSS